MRQSKNNKQIVDNGLDNKLLQATSESEINEIVQLFNLNMKKKDVIRANKLSDLQDKIAEQISARIDKHAGEFSNKDLLDYLNAIQNILSKQNFDESIQVPQIAVQNNTVNVNIEDSLSRESRQRIQEAIKSILNSQSTIDVDSIELLQQGDEQ